ncbi:hypothetical protein M436DRAFT_81502 [Aureobasidium namibiae CBS 147.97]|uniref:Uncharacterized protein n=1 Tax=Aureobasidium namibiae CBS 147.97 TaxID=1043004 RepID=A0A074WLV7_9PEZI
MARCFCAVPLRVSNPVELHSAVHDPYTPIYNDKRNIYGLNAVDMNPGRRTSHSFNLVLEDCYRKLDQASRDLEYHTAHVTAEIDQLKAHIRHLKETIPRDDEREDRRQLMHRRHTLQIDWVKRGVWSMSTKTADLRFHLRYDEPAIQRAVNRVLSRLAGEMPCWLRNGS